MLSLYDTELDGVLRGISARATISTTNVELTAEEKAAVQRFVVQKWSARYSGMDAVLAGKAPKIDRMEACIY